MTNSKDDDQQPEKKEKPIKNRPSSINIQQRDWSQIQAISQSMTPVQIISDSDLHQELGFYDSTPFKNNISQPTASTPTSVTIANTYFDYQQPPPQHRSATMFQTNNSNNRTPQFNIPSDTNDFSASSMRDSYQAPTTSSPAHTSALMQHQTQALDRQSLSMSLYFEQERSQRRLPTSEGNERSLLLAHEPGMFGREIASQSVRGMPNGANNIFYADQSMSLSSSPSSPITNGGYDHQLQTYFEKQDQVPKNSSSDRFEAMFLSSTPDIDRKEKTGKRATPRTQKQQQFRFKKSAIQDMTTTTTGAVASSSSTVTEKASQNQHPLDFLLLSRHNMETELGAASTYPAGELLGNKRKNKQKAPAANAKKALGNKPSIMMDDSMDIPHERQRSYSDNDQDGEGSPVIGDGAQSYSSMGSSSSRTSQQTLTKDDKRRRNTAASARFRIKKKMREQALQNTACEMTEKAQRMEQRVHELEREIKWLKALVVEKNEARLEQLVRERPPNSTAFPLPSSSSSHSPPYSQQQHHYQQQQQSNGSRRVSRNTRQRNNKNQEYENDDDGPYQNGR